MANGIYPVYLSYFPLRCRNKNKINTEGVITLLTMSNVIDGNEHFVWQKNHALIYFFVAEH